VSADGIAGFACLAGQTSLDFPGAAAFYRKGIIGYDQSRGRMQIVLITKGAGYRPFAGTLTGKIGGAR
jgi:hypothetical protein